MFIINDLHKGKRNQIQIVTAHKSLAGHVCQWFEGISHDFNATLVISNIKVCTCQINFACEYTSDNTTLGTGTGVNGWGHTPKRNLHLMLVYVTFIEDDSQLIPDELSPIWPKNSIPNYMQPDFYGNSDAFDLDCQLPSSSNVHGLSLSKWFREMSMYSPYGGSNQGHGFSVTAKVFHVQISKALTFPATGNKANYMELTYSQRAILALQTNPLYVNEDWSKFDNRTNNPRFLIENSSSNPDGIIDFMGIHFRQTASDLVAMGIITNRAGQAGIDIFQSNGNIPISQNISNSFGTFSINQGYTLFYGFNQTDFNIYFLHEFSHCLFNSPHYMGANSGVGAYFYCSNGWGMMAGQQSWFQTINAWERLYLGWVEPTYITKQTITTDGIYELRDFATTGDALRIEIPNSEIINSNNSKPNYLYLENHQMISLFDQKSHSNSESPMFSGIYAFLSKTDFDNGIPGPGYYNNLLRPISKSGNWDFTYTMEGAVYNFTNGKPNDIGGQNQSQAIRIDVNNDGVLNYLDFEGQANNEMVWISNLNGSSIPFYSGNQTDRFNVDDEISISGNAPALNFPTFFPARQNVGGTLLGGYYLNGLKVKVLDYNQASGSYFVKVEFNYYNLEKNARWAAPLIILPNLTESFEPDLIVENNFTLEIDKSNTPNCDLATTQTPTHYADNNNMAFSRTPTNFSYNTKFKIEEEASLIIKQSAKIVVENASELVMNSNSKIEILKDGMLIIKSGSSIQLNSNCSLIVHEGGKVVVEPDSKFLYLSNSLIQLLASNSSIEFKPGSQLIIGDNSKFRYEGNGYCIFSSNYPARPNIVGSGQNSQIEFIGNQSKQKMIEVSGNVGILCTKDISLFEVRNATIVLNENSWISIDGPIKMNSVDMVSNPLFPLKKHRGLQLYGQKDIQISALKITNAKRGITALNSVYGNPLYLEGISTINCDIGIYCLGKGIEIVGANLINSSKHGIYVEGMDLPIIINSITAKGNSNGATIVGSSNSLARFDFPNFEYNGTAISGVNANITARCGIIRNSSNANIYLGTNSTLDLDPNQIKGAGLIDFSNTGVLNTPVLISLDKSNHSPYLNNARSNFISSNWKIYGTLRDKYNLLQAPNFYKLINVNQNFWSTNTVPTLPWPGIHYLVTYKYYFGLGFNSYINLNQNYVDNAPLTNFSDFTSCNPFIGGTNLSVFADLPAKYTLNGSSLQDLLVSGIQNLYQEEPDYISSMNSFKEILSCNFTTDEIPVWEQFVLFTFNKLNETISLGLKNSDAFRNRDSLTNVTPILEPILLLYENWIDKFENSLNAKFDLKLSKALFYRRFNLLLPCTELLVNLQSEATGADVYLVNPRLCS